MRLTFVLPGVRRVPSGGFRIVYQYASELSKRGHNVTVVHPVSVFHPMPNVKPVQRLARQVKSAVKIMYRMFSGWEFHVDWQQIHSGVHMVVVPTLHQHFIPDSDAVVATAWRTAEYVVKYRPCKGEKFYLIQHYETWDGPKSRVDATWRAPLHKIVIAKWLVEVGKRLGAQDMTYIPNPVDMCAFHLTRPISSREKRIAMLYHTSAWKGSRVGIRALERVHEQVPDCRAVLFGVTPRPNNLPDWIEYYQNPPQSFLRDEIYNRSAIYLCPSDTEGWGLPVAEAMACGCAVVSTDNGGVRDFVEEGISGLLRPPRDADGLAEALVTLLDNPSMRIALAEAGHAAIRSFCLERAVSSFENTLLRYVYAGGGSNADAREQS
ncbi:MAG: glycosyltransferase family 4 protein [Alicyclobacillus macrosporangiidus]|uniref:glycosyltransferase family 4 protein n=1 Tax=Alicyclobacillus macrosporangiidus TaxID=392015 RepID=UPI0026EC08E0|nr:glycosyltransferase family 4 protein [Alicyclobacillus macrosporangiidus]MCL6598840.1 glycosyltransferase family 4 protein [Alicyclobacillus macrosporangiidus]